MSLNASDASPHEGEASQSARRWFRPTLDILLRLLAVFLAASLCSFMTINQPVLRVLYDAFAAYGDFLANIGRSWGQVGARVLSAYVYSLIALITALGIGLALGIPAGFYTGVRPHTRSSSIVRILSYVGIMMPSFLLALFIMVFFVLWVLPATGIRFILVSNQVSEFDPRRLFPIALTLSARPLAYFATVTAVATRELMSQDYARTAYSKGLAGRQVLFRHIWPNVMPGLLNAIPIALLFSMSSLIIVEFVFNWPGAGRELLFQVVSSSRPGAQNAAFVSFLLASFGITYILAILGIEVLRRRIDPLAERDGP